VDRSALLGNLWQKIDGFVAKVQSRYPDDLACRAGCSSCCLGGLSVTSVEADAIRDHLETLDAATRSALAISASTETEAHCAALDPEGRCRIYEARPIVCRSHGLAIRFEDARATDDEKKIVRRLPLIDACSLNFIATPLASVAADCVLDQTNLSTTLALIDRAGATEGEKTRISLASLLSSDPVSTAK
jgi:Fe-S-cluster containining protein